MPEKRTIGEIAKQLNITTRAIRYYDQKGLVKPSEISDSGYRLYSENQVKQLEVIIFLKELDFSLKDIQKLLQEHNGEQLINTLLKEQIERNQKEVKRLEEQNQKISQLKSALTKSKESSNIMEVMEIMTDEMKYRNLTRRMWKKAAIMLVIEALGMAISAYFFVNKMNVIGYGASAVLVLILVILSFGLLKEYYQQVAYICPNCDYKFVPELAKFMIASHTPHTRRLRCPNCGKKSFCIETVR